MKIEHIAMYVNDIEKVRDFFVNISAENQVTDIIIQKTIFVLTSFLLMTVHDWK